MRVIVIGATGHVGGYLVPRLVQAGHEVVAISRGVSSPYRSDDAWSTVEMIAANREEEDRAGTFGTRIRDLQPDAVIDMVCFTAESAAQLVDAVRDRVQQLLMCTSIWVKGTPTAVPASEDDTSQTWGDYGLGKRAIEELLAVEAARGVPNRVLRPGHISGPGWAPINPQANLDLGVWTRLAHGEPLLLPNFGTETLHHVHADDVAQAFELALAAGPPPSSERYNIVSERAITLRGYAEAVASWFGQEARLEFAGFDEFRGRVGDDLATTTYDHAARSQSMSIEKARAELGYRPAHTSLETVREAVDWLLAEGRIPGVRAL